MVFLPLEFAGHEGLVTIEQRETGSVVWCVSDGITDYESALAAMERRVGLIVSGQARELIWLVEHSPLYTAGTSAKSQDLIQPERFPVHQAGRGGQYTYHGTGQRVAYVMLNIKQRQLDVRSLVRKLEAWLIETLAAFNVTAEARPDRIGIWVPMPPSQGPGEKKIAAIGLRIRRGVTFHGVSLNVEPDLEHFSGIVPCGIADHGVTSLADLGYTISMEEVDMALRSAFEAVFQAQTIDENATSIMAR